MHSYERKIVDDSEKDRFINGNNNNNNKFSKASLSIPESETMKIDTKAKLLKKEGHNIINFSIGEPDMNMPKDIKDAYIKALNDNKTKYGPAQGIPELREEISKKFLKENNISYTPEEIIITNGAKQALYNSLFILLNSGDEVIIPSPYWVTYIEQVKACNAIPVIAHTNEDFSLNIDSINEKITKKTKAIIINSPNNPTGAVYRFDDLKKIAKLAAEKNLYIISDEIYEYIIYDEEHKSIASINNDVKELTITVNGFSKSYAMTGLRIGYAAASREITTLMTKFQSHTTSNVNTSLQHAALAALDNKEFPRMMCNEFKKRTKTICNELDNMELNYKRPKGTFFVFPNISRVSDDSMQFSEYLLDKAKIAVVPGKAFGANKNIRISYALPENIIIEGMRRLKTFLEDLEDIKKR